MSEYGAPDASLYNIGENPQYANIRQLVDLKLVMRIVRLLPSPRQAILVATFAIYSLKAYDFGLFCRLWIGSRSAYIKASRRFSQTEKTGGRISRTIKRAK